MDAKRRERDEKMKLPVINTTTREGLVNLTTLFVIIIGFSFAHLFIIRLSFSAVSKCISYIVSIGGFWILKSYIFRSGKFSVVRENEKDPFVITFQKHFPSKYMARKFDISVDEASSYWLRLFNTLPDKNKQISYSRGFYCKHIYYSLKFLLIMILLSSFLIVVELLQPCLGITIFNSEMSIPRIIYLIVLGFLLIYIYLNNNPKKENGCWETFHQVNKMSHTFINDNFNSLQEVKDYLNEKENK